MALCYYFDVLCVGDHLIEKVGASLFFKIIIFFGVF